jgi:hypothetical protein
VIGNGVRLRRRATPHYRGFATAAEAIRFAVEEMPAVKTLGAWMQVGDEHFDDLTALTTRARARARAQEIIREFSANGT